MQVTFIGTGEAFDQRYANTSLLLHGEDDQLLVEAGYSAVTALWRHELATDSIRAVFVSHHHADHYGGLPMLLLRWAEDRRIRDLEIIGPGGTEERVRRLCELSYAGTFDELPYAIRYREVAAGELYTSGPFRLFVAPTTHLTKHPELDGLAVRVECGGRILTYSSDTGRSKAVTELARGSHLLVHEAYVPSDHARASTNTHASPRVAARVAAEAGVEALALVHVSRRYRQDRAMLREATAHFRPVFLPADGTVVGL